MADDFDLTVLQGTLDRIDQLVTHDYEFLGTYWDQSPPCFFANETVKGRVSVTTTSFCLLALIRDPSLASRFEVPNTAGVDPPVLAKLGQSLTTAAWDSEQLGANNIYTTPIVIACLARLKNSHTLNSSQEQTVFTNDAIAKIHAGIDAILTNLKENQGPACFKQYFPSAYLTFWSYDALTRASSAALVAEKDKVGCIEALYQIEEWSFIEVHKQIAFFTANDLSSFDAMQLGYSLVVSLRSRERKFRPSDSVLGKALEVIFDSQESDGLWQKGLPIFHYTTRGSVYVFGFELLDLLLDYIPTSQLAVHLDSLVASLAWAELNVNTEGSTKGWRSNNLGFPGGAEAWSTAAVILYLRLFAKLVNQLRNDQVLREFHAIRISTSDDSRLQPRKFYDGEVPVSGKMESLRAILQEKLITPHKVAGSLEARRYSAVFYGPPGTAKTTLAEAIAYSLGWPYVYLQTSDFSSGGFEAITARAREIFTKLGMLNKAVILFDEVEEFVRNRDDNSLPPSSKMITTSMLSLIQDLRRRKNVLFIVTTNFLKNFDAAIIRPGGRFDMVLLVPPPSSSEKRRMLNERLVQVVNGSDKLKIDIDAVRSAIHEFVSANEDPIEFFAYSEWSSLVDEAVQRIVKSPQDAKTCLEKLLGERKDGITIRDTLKNDYVDSKEMVRIQ